METTNQNWLLAILEQKKESLAKFENIIGEAEKDNGTKEYVLRGREKCAMDIKSLEQLIEKAFDQNVYETLVAIRPMKTAPRGLDRICESFFKISKEELTFRDFFSKSKQEVVNQPKFGKASYDTIIKALESKYWVHFPIK